MHKIPYVFRAIPDEFLTEDFLSDPIMIRLIAWMMKRIYTYPHKIALKRSAKHLLLEPFEFIYGRDKCAKDANISPNNARTRLKQLMGLGYIEEVVAKSTSTFSVYRLVTTAFKQNFSQQPNQHSDQQEDQLVHHKRKTEIKKDKNIKEALNVSSKHADKSPLSDNQKEKLYALLAYSENKKLKIYEPSLTRWLKIYEIDRITGNLHLLEEQMHKVINHEAWLETALKENYASQKNNIQKNREFAKQFKEKNQWVDLHLTENYCTHLPSDKDYQYFLIPTSFQKMLKDCFDQYNEIDNLGG